MEKPFLGRGVGFPIKIGESDIEVVKGEDSIHQSIEIILRTAKGERIMRPDFGCGIYDLLFDMATDSTAGKISQAVREALLRFEPRIDIVDIQVTPKSGIDEHGMTLYISIDYQVRATNNAFNLVYPFYLERISG